MKNRRQRKKELGMRFFSGARLVCTGVADGIVIGKNTYLPRLTQSTKELGQTSRYHGI